MKTGQGKVEEGSGELQGLEVAAVNVLNRAMSDGCGGYEWAKAELRELVRRAWSSPGRGCYPQGAITGRGKGKKVLPGRGNETKKKM